MNNIRLPLAMPLTTRTAEPQDHRSAQDILTVQEAAALLRVNRSTVWRWCKDGTLRSAFKIGRNWRLHRTELDQIIGGAQGQ